MFSKLTRWHAGDTQRSRWPGVAVVGAAGAALTVLAAGGIAAASNTASTGTITACYKPAKAPATLTVPAGGTCPAKNTTLTWNKVGPQGPRGAQGPQGPAGAVHGLFAATSVNVTLKAGAWTRVMTSGAAPTTGVYFVTASVGIWETQDSLAGCEFASDTGAAMSPVFVAQQSPFSTAGTLSMTSPVVLTAWHVVTVQCALSAAIAGAAAITHPSAMTATLIDAPVATARAIASLRFPSGLPSLRQH